MNQKEIFLLLEERGIFKPIDIAIGQNLSQEQDAFFFLLCYLSLAHRQGHTFIKKENGFIFPTPETLLFDEKHDVDIINLTEVNSILSQGFLQCNTSNLPSSLILEESRLYFERFWNLEQSIIGNYVRLQKEKVDFEGDIEIFTSLVQKGFENKEITFEQKEAILSLANRRISSLFGGPGTGKTYTIGKFLKWLILSKKDTSYLNILLAGPTGKATSNLENSMLSQFANTSLPSNINYEVKTLHALLKMKRFTTPSDIQVTLPYDYIIIDEASMIDMQLMALLLSSIHRSKLIFLGDPWQLPPVEGGAPFEDFVIMEKKSNPLELTACLRTEIQDIQLLSSFVKDGNEEEALLLLEKNEENKSLNGVSFRKINITSPLDDAIIYCSHKFEKQFEYSDLPSDLLKKQTLFRLLSPIKEGPIGISSLNKSIKSRLEKRSLLVPIIISQNDYQLNLMNGEIGFSYENIAYFTDKVSNSIRKIPLVLLSHYDLAYALSVHKSQGSEFDHVIVFLPPGSLRFGRKMLYTAITRARKKVEIWGDLSTIKSIIRNDETRLSFLADGISSHC